MLFPTDERLQEIIENAADDLLGEVDMFLDEGSWTAKIYNRCEELGLEVSDAVKIREIAEEVMAVRLARAMLARLVIDTEEAQRTPDKVFIQGAGWIEEYPRKEEDA